jgi:hypothetical protein
LDTLELFPQKPEGKLPEVGVLEVVHVYVREKFNARSLYIMALLARFQKMQKLL